MGDSNHNKYISLKTAAGLYGYTRDHLGLMVRRSKLKGIKLGSYYVTTNEWMTDFIKNFSYPDHPAAKNKLSNKLLTEILSEKNKNQFVEQKDANSNFEDKILKDLEQYKSSFDNQSVGDGNAPKAFSVSIGAPFVILPIRKMRHSERDEILDKVE